mmetsp:Transcript_1435/g.2486  ORF Transcript_1435/g.2486 Transcript_1435/m.2486 type:complete len:124 (+) Transcript_1435:188-559(+)
MSTFFSKIGNYFRGKTEEETEDETSTAPPPDGGGGFSVRKTVAVPIDPLITTGGYGGGGVQGLGWYVGTLEQDDDGNVGNCFYEEKPLSVVSTLPPGAQSRPVSWRRVQIVGGDVLQEDNRIS